MGGSGGVAMGGASMGGSGGSGGAMLDGWARQFGDALDIQTGTGVAAAPNGDVLVTGSFGGQMQMDGVSLSASGTRSVFVARLTSSGDVVWAKGFAGASLFDDQAVAVDANGNVLLVGGFFGSIDFGGGPLASAGNEDMYLAKLDANGNHLWSKRFGDGGPQPRYAVRVGADAAGNVLLATSYTGTVDLGGGPLAASGGGPDLLVAKLDANGNHLWSKRFGDAEAGANDTGERLRAFGVDAFGAVYIAGGMTGTIDFGAGPHSSPGGSFVAKLDSAGNLVFGNVYDASNAQFTALAVTPQGGAVVAGTFNFDVDFGGGTLSSLQGANILLEVNQAGQYVWAKQTKALFHLYGAATSQSGATTFVGDTFGDLDLTQLGGPVLPSDTDSANAVILTLGAGGALLAARNYTHPAMQIFPDRQLYSVAYDPSGYILTTGSFMDGLDMGYGLLQGDEWGDVVVARLPASL